jgi:hypothetical protein
VSLGEWGASCCAITISKKMIILPEDGPSRPKHVVISSRVSNKVHVHIVVLDGIIFLLMLCLSKI